MHAAAPGRHVSPWVATAPPADLGDTAFRPYDADVVVVGAGVVGLTTALLLQQAGRDVVLVDSGAVGQGVTAHSTVKVTVAQGTVLQQLARRLGEHAARLYAEVNAAGLARVRSLVDEHGIDCDLEVAPHVLYARDASSAQAVRAEAALAARFGLPAQPVDDVPLPFEVAAAASFADQVSLHPVRYLHGLARAFLAAGGSLVEHARALAVHEGDPCRVTTTAGELRGRHVVVATHYPFLDRGLHFARLVHKREYGVAVRLPEGTRAGMTYAVDSPTRSTRTLRLDGERLLVVVGESHPVGSEPDTPSRWAALARWAQAEVGAGDVVFSWSTQDVSTADGLPYVGWLTPGTDRLLTATGFGGWGMTNGTAAAELLASLVLGRRHPWAEPLDARRVGLPASAGTLVKVNLEVGAHFVGDRLRRVRAGRPEDLAPGQAAVLRVGARHLACYRDEEGALHVLSARCTHLGCLVSWNPGERSWDCPCHASRFDHTGAVLEGPAVRPLPPARPS